MRERCCGPNGPALPFVAPGCRFSLVRRVRKASGAGGGRYRSGSLPLPALAAPGGTPPAGGAPVAASCAGAAGMGGGRPGRVPGRGPAYLWVTVALAWGAGAALAVEGPGVMAQGRPPPAEEEEEAGLAGGEGPCGADGWAQDAVPPGAAFVAAASYRGPGNNDTRSNKALPILLWWSGSLFPHFPGDTERIDCPGGSCLVTRSRRVVRHRRTKALIFYGTDFRAYEAPLPRLPHQTWALFHEESPMNNYVLSHSPGIQLFNYTATFRRESDYPLTLQWLPGVEYLRGPAVPLAEKDAWRRKGYAPVLYMQSHCDVPSDRDRYVRELMKYIQVGGVRGGAVVGYCYRSWVHLAAPLCLLFNGVCLSLFLAKT